MNLNRDLETITKWFKALEPIGEDTTGGVTRLVEVERKLNITEEVMRYIIVKQDYFL